MKLLQAFQEAPIPPNEQRGHHLVAQFRDRSEWVKEATDTQVADRLGDTYSALTDSMTTYAGQLTLARGTVIMAELQGPENDNPTVREKDFWSCSDEFEIISKLAYEKAFRDGMKHGNFLQALALVKTYKNPKMARLMTYNLQGVMDPPKTESLFLSPKEVFERADGIDHRGHIFAEDPYNISRHTYVDYDPEDLTLLYRGEEIQATIASNVQFERLLEARRKIQEHGLRSGLCAYVAAKRRAPTPEEVAARFTTPLQQISAMQPVVFQLLLQALHAKSIAQN